MDRRTSLASLLLLFLGLQTVSSAPVAPGTDGGMAPKEVRARLAKRFNFTGLNADTPLREGLDVLANTFEVKILIDVAAFKNSLLVEDPEKLPVQLPRMDKVPFRTVLQMMLEQAKGDFLISPEGVVWVVPEAEWLARSIRQPVTKAIERKPLHEAIREFADQHSFSIVLDERRAGDKAKTPVTADFQNVPLENAVKMLAELAELKAVVVDRMLYVTTTENAKVVATQTAVPASARRHVRAKLDRRVNLDGFEANTPLKEALGFLSERFGTTILIDVEAFKNDLQIMEPENQPVKLPKMHDVPLRSVLRLLLSQGSGQFVIDPDGIVFVVPGGDKVNERLLKQWVCESFERKPLADAVRELSDKYGISIVLDEKQAGEKARTVITTDFEDVPLETAVAMLAKLADLTAVPLDRAVFITTHERAREARAEQTARKLEEEKRKKKEEEKPPQQEGDKVGG